MKWVNILHIYQPPTQSREVVETVVKESYEKIIRLMDAYPKLRLTVNITGSLLELLKKYGHDHIIAGLRAHAERGAVEFLGSAMYHPILPLLGKKEIQRQIRLNDKISKECFGAAYKPAGFYFPEMAYSHAAAEAVAEAGYRWTILDEIHTMEKIDFGTRYKIKGLDLKVVFRNSAYSRTFPPESLVRDLKKLNDQYVVTCHDGELYGHWHKDDRGYYEKAFANEEIRSLTVSEYLDELPKEEEIAVRDASWESLPEELAQNIALGLWNDPRNEVHRLLEGFKREVLTLVEGRQDDPGYADARHHADRGVASCAWWWASERKLGHFSPVSWNPTEIEKGAKELYDAIRALGLLPESDAKRIDDLFAGLRKAIWKKHKEKYDPSYPLE